MLTYPLPVIVFPFLLLCIVPSSGLRCSPHFRFLPLSPSLTRIITPFLSLTSHCLSFSPSPSLAIAPLPLHSPPRFFRFVFHLTLPFPPLVPFIEVQHSSLISFPRLPPNYPLHCSWAPPLHIFLVIRFLFPHSICLPHSPLISLSHLLLIIPNYPCAPLLTFLFLHSLFASFFSSFPFRIMSQSS